MEWSVSVHCSGPSARGLMPFPFSEHPVWWALPAHCGMALVCGWLLKFELHQDSAICFAILSYVTLAICLVPPNTQAIIKPSEATRAVRSHDHCYLPFFWFSSIRPCIFSLGFAMSPLQKSESQIWPCPGQRWWWWCSFPWQPNTALCMPMRKVVPIAKGWRTPVRRNVNRKQDWLWGGGVS